MRTRVAARAHVTRTIAERKRNRNIAQPASYDEANRRFKRRTAEQRVLDITGRKRKRKRIALVSARMVKRQAR